MEGKGGRTEKATAKKRSEERRKGNICLSQDVVSCFVMVCGLIGLRIMVPQLWHQVGEMMRRSFLFKEIGEWSPASMQSLFISIVGVSGIILSPVFVGALLGAVLGSMLQTKPFYSTQALKVKWSALNPVKGFKKLFSIQSTVTLGISILKMLLIIFICYKLVGGRISILATLPQMDSFLSVKWVMGLILKMTFWVMFLFVGIALIDWVYKKRQYEKGIMMTKQEVKDETKQQEVSPVVKRALAKKMRELTLLRMMAEVPKADVIVTNPTHVAVALRYDPESMNAPKVVAKGLRLVAERIKKVARENNVPILERPPLARSLYKSVKVGKEIPSKFYEAVAAILAYLHKIGRGIDAMN